MSEQGPPSEAYSRVTNPERYRVLHGVAEQLLDRLDAEYLVDRAEGSDVDRTLAGRRPVERVVRLTPSEGNGAPLTIGFSSFPGLYVRYGVFLATALPHCRCDACDEDPVGLSEELTRRSRLLAQGLYKEELLPGNEWQYVFGGGFPTPGEALPMEYEASRGGPINTDYIDGPATPARNDWGPWIRRPHR